MTTGRRLRRFVPIGIALGLAALVGACNPTASPSPSPLAAASPTAGVTAPPPSATPGPTPVATIGACEPANLAARITLWSGAAGHRIADVELTNAGTRSCLLAATDRPQLVDGNGSVLIDGAPPAASAFLTIGPGSVLTTLVDADNYCGPAPVAPITVAFVFPSGLGRIVATPVSPTDSAGLPPCMGNPGSAGQIVMHPWAP